jgi:hypothetical protein
MKTRLVSLALIALAGCGVAKPEVVEDFSDLASLDEKSDSFSYRMRVVGTLGFGQTSQPVKYTSSPRFRAFKVVAKKGDSLDVWVRSSDGDAVSWITDYRFNVIAYNDDADASTFDSHLTATAARAGNYWIIFREYGLDKATFSVSLGALGCQYNGNTYEVGESFPSSDLCNTCNCGEGGLVGCTERACLDCRTSGCGSGKYCTVCRTINGPAYVCLPNGAVC